MKKIFGLVLVMVAAYISTGNLNAAQKIQPANLNFSGAYINNNAAVIHSNGVFYVHSSIAKYKGKGQVFVATPYGTLELVRYEAKNGMIIRPENNKMKIIYENEAGDPVSMARLAAQTDASGAPLTFVYDDGATCTQGGHAATPCTDAGENRMGNNTCHRFDRRLLNNLLGGSRIKPDPMWNNSAVFSGVRH